MSQPILDDDYTEEEVVNKNLTRNIPTRVIIYLAIMMVGGSIVLGFKIFMPYLIVFAFAITVQAIILSLVLETIRYFFRKRKEEKTGVREIRDPFWFEVLEGGFSIWLLIMFLLGLNIFTSS